MKNHLRIAFKFRSLILALLITISGPIPVLGMYSFEKICFGFQKKLQISIHEIIIPQYTLPLYTFPSYTLTQYSIPPYTVPPYSIPPYTIPQNPIIQSKFIQSNLIQPNLIQSNLIQSNLIQLNHIQPNHIQNTINLTTNIQIRDTIKPYIIKPYKLKKKPKFRIVAYLTTWTIQKGLSDSLDFNKIDYLNIGFINPDSTVNFHPIKALNQIIEEAHKKGVHILASIAGGEPPKYYSKLLKDSLRKVYINNLIQFIVNNGFNGVDVDIEGDQIDKNYEKFVIELHRELKSRKLEMTGAISTAYKNLYTQKSLKQLAFYNIMSYDQTGPWRPDLPGPHSPYSMAEADLNYWNKIRKIHKSKLALGLPFYGYGFGEGMQKEFSYKEIIDCYPGAENVDSVKVEGVGTVYYNGIQQIKNKTLLALKKSGGLMFWEWSGDAKGNFSLLSTIHQTLMQKK